VGREGRDEGDLNWKRKGSEGALTRKGWTAALRRESTVRRVTLVPEGGASSMNEEGGWCAWARMRVRKRGKRGVG
jgi:hypothetical protein